MLNQRLLEVADEAIRNGIEVRVRVYDITKPGLATGTFEAFEKAGVANGTYFLEVAGFYKHGSVCLVHNDHMNYTQVFGRYALLDTIGDTLSLQGANQRLADINYTEFLRYQDRGFTLDQQWTPLLVRHGFIKPVVTTTYVAA